MTLHAVIVHTTIDPSQMTEAIGGIEAVKQRLSGMPGFQHAYWIEPIDGHGLQMSLWQHEDAATAAAPPLGFSPAPGVTVERVEIRRVIADA